MTGSGCCRMVAAACVGCALLAAVPALAVTVGETAPRFRVESGSDEVLSSEMIAGKVAVIFYETKDTIELNRALKDRLNAWYLTEPPGVREEIARVAVIHCSSFMPVVWKRNLREHSKKEGLTIYGDWDGSMAKAYGMEPDTSNLLIVDRSGTVRYRRAGVVAEAEFPGIEKLLTELLR